MQFYELTYFMNDEAWEETVNERKTERNWVRKVCSLSENYNLSLEKKECIYVYSYSEEEIKIIYAYNDIGKKKIDPMAYLRAIGLEEKNRLEETLRAYA